MHGPIHPRVVGAAYRPWAPRDVDCMQQLVDDGGCHKRHALRSEGPLIVITIIIIIIMHADSIPGRPRPVGRPHYTWKDGAMQDLNALGPRLQLDLLRNWPKLALDRELWRGVTSRC